MVTPPHWNNKLLASAATVTPPQSIQYIVLRFTISLHFRKGIFRVKCV